MRRFRRSLLLIDDDEVSFDRRAFRSTSAAARARLESAGIHFLRGYRLALDDEGTDRLAGGLATIDPDVIGFAHEGASMALLLLDRLSLLDGGRFRAFVDGPGSGHVYMAHVGAGWALARLPWCRLRFERSLGGLDPLLRWLAVDGFGFHEGYFRPGRWVRDRDRPGGLSPAARRVFDQGLGRSLWFVEGASPGEIAATIAAFSAPRRADLWGGLGLAAAYAGGLDAGGLDELADRAGVYRPELAQGACFAAQARRRAGNPADHTAAACEAFAGIGPDDAAEATDWALDGLILDGTAECYLAWRRRIRDRIAAPCRGT